MSSVSGNSSSTVGLAVSGKSSITPKANSSLTVVVRSSVKADGKTGAKTGSNTGGKSSILTTSLANVKKTSTYVKQKDRTKATQVHHHDDEDDEDDEYPIRVTFKADIPYASKMQNGKGLISEEKAKYDEQECEDIVKAIAKSESILMHEFQEQLEEEAKMNAQFNAELMGVVRDTYDSAIDAMTELIDNVKRACDQGKEGAKDTKQVAAHADDEQP